MPPSVRSSARSSKPSSKPATNPSVSHDVTYSHGRKLSVPREGASPSTWTKFSSELTMFVLSRYSLAVGLGTKIDGTISSATDLADQLLTDRERQMFTAWKKGKAPPRVDWRKLGQSLKNPTRAQLNRWEELTDALRNLYQDGSISKENCKAWVEEFDELMPLLNACKKVEVVRHDARPAKSGSSKLRRDVHEIIACRQMMGEIGKQRIRSSTKMKQIQKDASEREADLSGRIIRLNAELPKNRDAQLAMFEGRETYLAKLTKTRTDRVEMAADVTRQNQEVHVAEEFLKGRIEALEKHIKH